MDPSGSLVSGDDITRSILPDREVLREVCVPRYNQGTLLKHNPAAVPVKLRTP